ncbi:MAG: crossover junction endodeoxyribonuclease RuvC [Candidatus Doudnabacteria bacterium RIFCSPLOWO2_02_FULL_42_9]|uniref:Crossover junction endodeoxyribonuclease RuvC n=1 Tax=Candidatus Doudnabacteria bacterium RIFCSPHIGHO2_01_FULL_41_86 TaxID=1817821 RepID=A0A1F5N8P1_9BACT|nr:MAG: crossover junction endodeoxyribonuclease RuvC [Candidatus Doudnabacteria bacterium RIFCSPHIGHO2_01_FULL_41_86]OGE75118.1 MAG: crossover junction endodeoxyribonuclease RuvC [Candidatus Doudnabacteria bacterium RIFCSPHIGHO2_01_43_10]OGE86379.1 MAG: crossover junction endodeoxyribonuclease RuvC [Candidatus Doudnabacteria bacterium RIFCSPHIGHO2_12_FULL_42_22]OGE87378.1 MAG: crossover junction endodeoxyribonuclease RuvC [Candidatus Doudnabacteria bacterium RIFCSPHIGHO2_02_FULL_42_25]OGE92676
MKILGIDPGIGRTGYAILEQTGNNIVLKVVGCITTKVGDAEYQRLLEIKQDLDSIIKKYKPDAVCIESLFFAANAKTAMSVGQARGVIVVTAAEHKLKIIEVTPLQVKISATGYGKADKAQVHRMMQTVLKLKKNPKPDDAADAVAIAWSGISRLKFNK